jgi:hypothetical protein
VAVTVTSWTLPVRGVPCGFAYLLRPVNLKGVVLLSHGHFTKWPRAATSRAAGKVPVKWSGSTTPLKRVDFGFDISEDSPIMILRRPMRRPLARRCCPLHRRRVNQAYSAIVEHVPVRRRTTVWPHVSSTSRLSTSMPFHARTAYTPAGTTAIADCRPLLAGSSLRFSRAPWFWFRRYEVSNPWP